ncbi:MAG: hypothetical protein II953_05915, partial [Clostridia bacterium]|nr:hypothetical protein [Clostridia bacterium]
ACPSESEHVREDGETVSAFRLRVPCNARLNLCRKAAELVLRMFQLHEQRPRGDSAMFRLGNPQAA